MSWAQNAIIVSSNFDRAAFPRREPLAAVEPLDVSPLAYATTCLPSAGPGCVLASVLLKTMDARLESVSQFSSISTWSENQSHEHAHRNRGGG